jgi:phosphoenolpyruvate carboxykinase (ATP)
MGEVLTQHKSHGAGRSPRSAPRRFHNLPAAALTEMAVRGGEGKLADSGALVVTTGEHTGRSPEDKFIVRDERSADEVWWGEVNHPLSVEQFHGLYERVRAHLAEQTVYVQDLIVCADLRYRYRVRLTTEQAWVAQFARNLFVVPESAAEWEEADDDTVMILHAPTLRADPAVDGTRTETAIVLDLGRRIILIVGTHYAGEVKKSVFSLLQHALPARDVATMHCSANRDGAGNVALFFGLSGTGKTTLSNDPDRLLIGDDEHGWTDSGVFNFEGGCYAKTIDLSKSSEPMIYAATNRFGAILENVVVDPVTRVPAFADDTLTQNARAAFPLSFLPNATDDGLGEHPRHILLLTADAFGVLPPAAKLTREQALYYFLLGYTSKLAGTERGVDEPESTFSACFGAPFLPLPPATYVELLDRRLRRHQPEVWLINTGWTGGAYGVGHRMELAHTRAIVAAILRGDLADAPRERDEVFGFDVPTACRDVPSEMLHPRRVWQDPVAFDRTARRLAHDFTRQAASFAGDVSVEILAAGPRIA